MKTTLETPHSMNPHEPLDKLFHVLMTQSMYTDLQNLSVNFSLSKGAMIRLAINQFVCQVNRANTTCNFGTN